MIACTQRILFSQLHSSLSLLHCIVALLTISCTALDHRNQLIWLFCVCVGLARVALARCRFLLAPVCSDQPTPSLPLVFCHFSFLSFYIGTCLTGMLPLFFLSYILNPLRRLSPVTCQMSCNQELSISSSHSLTPRSVWSSL